MRPLLWIEPQIPGGNGVPIERNFHFPPTRDLALADKRSGNRNNSIHSRCAIPAGYHVESILHPLEQVAIWHDQPQFLGMRARSNVRPINGDVEIRDVGRRHTEIGARRLAVRMRRVAE